MLYTTISKIGEGTFGKVYRVKDENNMLCACKIIKYYKLDYDENEDILESFIEKEFKEFEILKKLNHPGIIKFIESSFTNVEAILITELWGTSIEHVEFSPTFFKSVIKQLSLALIYLHENYIHRDLKSKNIVVYNDIIKIIDFGECINKNEKNMNLRTTLCYAAPEMLLGEKNYTTAIDIWSLGCIFYEKYNEPKIQYINPIFTDPHFYHKWGKPLFNGNDHSSQLYEIFKLLGRPSENTYLTKLPNYNSYLGYPYWPQTTNFYNIRDKNAIDLLFKMFDYTPSNRITAILILEHPFLQ